MFATLSVIASNATFPAVESFSTTTETPVEVANLTEDQVDLLIDQLFEESAKSSIMDDISRFDAFKKLVAEQGMSSSLMAFADADGSLSTILKSRNVSVEAFETSDEFHQAAAAALSEIDFDDVATEGFVDWVNRHRKKLVALVAILTVPLSWLTTWLALMASASAWELLDRAGHVQDAYTPAQLKIAETNIATAVQLAKAFAGLPIATSEKGFTDVATKISAGLRRLNHWNLYVSGTTVKNGPIMPGADGQLDKMGFDDNTPKMHAKALQVSGQSITKIAKELDAALMKINDTVAKINADEESDKDTKKYAGKSAALIGDAILALLTYSSAVQRKAVSTLKKASKYYGDPNAIK